MKTLFTLLLATSLASSAFAYDEGRLTVTFASSSNVQVLIDNRIYSQDDNSVVLNNVQPGQHTIQIYKASRNGRNYGKSNNRADLLYSSTVYIKPSYDVDVMINRFGKAFIDEQAINARGRWDDRGYGNSNGSYGGYDKSGYSNNAGNQAMSDNEFNSLVQRIRSQWFGNGKMSIAKEAVGRSYFASGQVRQLLVLFSSDTDKLDLAKAAYRNTVDQRSYYQLYDVFQFQSSKDELDRYIKDYRY
ncbi:MAG: hypothetical protein JWP88_500 [Flaviaesturariibacter sp.]|nr:hypothetical protein [Flaviaesturariibacter sp.]